jgi:hypothetical protein
MWSRTLAPIALASLLVAGCNNSTQTTQVDPGASASLRESADWTNGRIVVVSDTDLKSWSTPDSQHLSRREFVVCVNLTAQEKKLHFTAGSPFTGAAEWVTVPAFGSTPRLAVDPATPVDPNKSYHYDITPEKSGPPGTPEFIVDEP